MLIVFVFVVLWASNVLAQPSKPNILVIFGDDIGQTNVSAYSFGLMGYRMYPGGESEPAPVYFPLDNDPYERR